MPTDAYTVDQVKESKVIATALCLEKKVMQYFIHSVIFLAVRTLVPFIFDQANDASAK